MVILLMPQVGGVMQSLGTGELWPCSSSGVKARGEAWLSAGADLASTARFAAPWLRSRSDTVLVACCWLVGAGHLPGCDAPQDGGHLAGGGGVACSRLAAVLVQLSCQPLPGVAPDF